MSAEEAKRLLNALPSEYAGTQFPVPTNQPDDFAVLRIAGEELDGQWSAGCYRIVGEIATVEEAVQACTTTLPQVRPTSQILKGIVNFPSLAGGAEAPEQDSNQ